MNARRSAVRLEDGSSPVDHHYASEPPIKHICSGVYVPRILEDVRPTEPLTNQPEQRNRDQTAREERKGRGRTPKRNHVNFPCQSEHALVARGSWGSISEGGREEGARLTRQPEARIGYVGSSCEHMQVLCTCYAGRERVTAWSSSSICCDRTHLSSSSHRQHA